MHLLRDAGLAHDDIVHIVPHQANSRITRRMGDLLINDYGWPTSTLSKLVDNFRYYGNLSNASIATALVELLRQGRLHDGQWIALPAVGGGMNYGCWLLRFHDFKYPEAILNPSFRSKNNPAIDTHVGASYYRIIFESELCKSRSYV